MQAASLGEQCTNCQKQDVCQQSLGTVCNHPLLLIKDRLLTQPLDVVLFLVKD